MLAVCALGAARPQPATASDFWDSVRGAPRGAGPAAQRVLRARAALADNHADLALLALGTVTPGEPDEAELLIVLGRAQAMSGDPSAALVSFERAATLLGDGVLVPESDALAMTRFALQAGRLPLALRALYGQADSAARPQTRAALRVLEGHILQALGPSNLEQAIAAYREALRTVPEHASALLGLALALHRQGARDAALAIAKRVRDPAQLEQSLLENALPRGERSARAALWRESIADMSAARDAWHDAMQEPGPWREHARTTLLAFDAANARGRSHGQEVKAP